MVARQERGSFFSILFTFFIDNLGWAIVFPIFAPLFLDSENLFFSADISLSFRTTILGVFLALYSFAQFLGAPLLGEFADRSGRKKALFISIFLTTIGYLLGAVGIRERSLLLLFVSRGITGLFSGNLSVCLASITDLSKNKIEKVKNFGYLSMIAGFSFIFGAFFGGFFSDSSISRYFNPAVPFWFGGVLSFLNLLFILFAFQEPVSEHKKLKYDFWEGIHNIQKALQTKKIKTIYLIYFLFILGWTILFQFSPVVMVEKFIFSNSQIGNLAAFMGVCWALGAFITNKVLIKKFSQGRILEFCLLIFTVLCGVMGFLNYLSLVVVVLGVCIFIGGAAWPLCANLISNLASDKIQGKILGMSQSMQSLAMAVGPVLGGVVSHSHLYAPFILASLFGLIAALLYFKGRF